MEKYTTENKNRVQEYMIKVFKHDLNDNDFKDLKTVIKTFLANKLMHELDLKDNNKLTTEFSQLNDIEEKKLKN